MTFKEFSEYLQKIEKTSSRLDMTVILAELLKKIDKQELKIACYLMGGRLVPSYQSLEFQLSVKMVMRAIVRLKAQLNKDKEMVGNLFGDLDSSIYENEVNSEYKKLGDVGLVVERIARQELGGSKNLTISDVYQQLIGIAKAGGVGSQERKVGALVSLLAKLDSVSAKFVVRIVVGKLRLGFSTMTIIDSLSWALNKNKSDSQKIEEAYQKKADIGLLVETYLSAKNKREVDKVLSQYSAEVGVPIVPALCQRLNSAGEIIETMKEVIVEPKYDGLRIQIHINKKVKLGGEWKEVVKAYTRNLEEVSHMFPELISVANQVNCDRCVLDAEAVGVDNKTGKLVAFQETITRKRKHGVAQRAEELPIRFYVFDVLIADNQCLVDQPLIERKLCLEKLLKDGDFAVKTKYFITRDSDELRKFHENQLKVGLEGAVIKKVKSVYKSGRKGWRWVKIKEEEGSRGKLSDTIDAVVMGYYFGRGKRTSFGMGALLIGVLDKKNQYKTLAKIGTGLTDEQFKEIKQRVKNLEVKNKPNVYDVHKNLFPDVWLEPSLVIEIAADELTKSPIHTAGIALRFPRLVRIRDDKNCEQVTTMEELITIKN